MPRHHSSSSSSLRCLPRCWTIRKPCFKIYFRVVNLKMILHIGGRKDSDDGGVQKINRAARIYARDEFSSGHSLGIWVRPVVVLTWKTR
ncbi:hypothetical protein HanIR_Chr08g0355901 [Helianthus annuus]|nr:hypothetical protein HanIR_Chr08g0355901 [Helianthus annuus]